MNNNILRELEPNILRNGDASYTSIDMCIKQNNIFGLLFISELIPNIIDIIKIFKNLLSSLEKEKENIFTLIICICSEQKQEYEETILKISKLSCFILPYNLDITNKIIDKYNIIILPSFVLLNKEGKNLEYLNNEEIEKINKEKIKGWKKTLSIVLPVKKVDKYYLGMEGAIFGHDHTLFFSDYISKGLSYGRGNWFCEICGDRHLYTEKNFFCDLCGFNVCDICYEKLKKY